MVDDARRETDVTLVELAGGLFTPLSETMLNADLLRDLDPDWSILVGPDRLGILHDVLAAVFAARTRTIGFDAVVLMAPQAPDASTGHNALELHRFIDTGIIADLPRGEPSELVGHPMLLRLARALVETGPMGSSQPDPVRVL
jgi:dethiobiotin synthetase